MPAQPSTRECTPSAATSQLPLFGGSIHLQTEMKQSGELAGEEKSDGNLPYEFWLGLLMQSHVLSE